MKIEELKTCELVEELSKRIGVERIETPVEGQDEIAVEEYENRPSNITIKSNYIYDKVRPGPAIILRVID